MAGFVICCGFLSLVISLYLFSTTFMYLLGKFTLTSIINVTLYGIAYFFGSVLYLSLYIQAMKGMHSTALDIIKKKEENKRIYKEEQLKSNARVMISILVKHLLFLAITISAAAYFQIWFIKLPLIFYICSMLGYVACYPLSEESTSLLFENKFMNVETELVGKTLVNTLIFLLMSLTYYYYV